MRMRGSPRSSRRISTLAFRAEPLMATRLGDHRFDDKLDDLSPEARAANVERDRKALAELPRKVDSQHALARTGRSTSRSSAST